MLPRLGGIVAGDADSYRYLAESIRTFPDQETLAGDAARGRLRPGAVRNLSGGIAAIHSGGGCDQPGVVSGQWPERKLMSCRQAVLLIVAGGIAAYKALELIRLLRKRRMRGHLRADRAAAGSSSRRCRCRR